MRNPLLAAAACLFFFVTLTCSAQTAAPAGDAPQYSPIPGFDSAAMDKTADPCVDFYQYACGNFAKLHPIPSDLPAFDQFANLFEFNTQALHQIVEKTAAAHAAAGTDEQKIGDYYAACVDTDAIDKRGLAPIQPELDRIAALHSKEELPALIAHLNRMSVGVFFDYGSQQDFKDATREIAYIDQSGLGLPEKDYYLRTDDKSVETRKQYVAHLANVLKLLGDQPDAAQAEAQKIMDLETALARASQGNVERRDPDKIYHMMPLTSFSATAPVIDTAKYIELMGSPSVQELNVVSPDFFPALNKTIADTDLATIQAYLRAHLADSFAMRLPHAFDDENFDFYGRKLTGTPEQQARWKRCVQATDGSLGEALGKLYVAQYFTPDMKASTLREVHDIEAAMGKDIDAIDWMSPETKVKAKEKLRAVADKIGYPEVARLLEARYPARRCSRQLIPLPRIRSRSSAEQNRQARRSPGMASNTLNEVTTENCWQFSSLAMVATLARSAAIWVRCWPTRWEPRWLSADSSALGGLYRNVPATTGRQRTLLQEVRQHYRVHRNRPPPVARTSIALPAGIARMRRVKFHLYTFAVPAVLRPGHVGLCAGPALGTPIPGSSTGCIALTPSSCLRWRSASRSSFGSLEQPGPHGRRGGVENRFQSFKFSKAEKQRPASLRAFLPLLEKAGWPIFGVMPFDANVGEQRLPSL